MSITLLASIFLSPSIPSLESRRSSMSKMRFDLRAYVTMLHHAWKPVPSADQGGCRSLPMILLVRILVLLGVLLLAIVLTRLPYSLYRLLMIILRSRGDEEKVLRLFYLNALLAHWEPYESPSHQFRHCTIYFSRFRFLAAVWERTGMRRFFPAPTLRRERLAHVQHHSKHELPL